MPVNLFPEGIEELLYGPAGPVFRHTVVVAEAIKDVAAGLVPEGVRQDGDTDRPHLKDTGEVRIVGRHVSVVFTAEHAAAYHNGSRPHVIRPVRANVLAFEWPSKGPGVFFFPQVNHPGTEPHPFLIEAMALIGEAPIA